MWVSCEQFWSGQKINKSTAMWTRMAPFYANPFMRNLEEDLLKSEDYRSNLWLKLIDYIIVVRTHTYESLSSFSLSTQTVDTMFNLLDYLSLSCHLPWYWHTHWQAQFPHLRPHQNHQLSAIPLLLQLPIPNPPNTPSYFPKLSVVGASVAIPATCSISHLPKLFLC